MYLRTGCLMIEYVITATAIVFCRELYCEELFCDSTKIHKGSGHASFFALRPRGGIWNYPDIQRYARHGQVVCIYADDLNDRRDRPVYRVFADRHRYYRRKIRYPLHTEYRIRLNTVYLGRRRRYGK